MNHYILCKPRDTFHYDIQEASSLTIDKILNATWKYTFIDDFRMNSNKTYNTWSTQIEEKLMDLFFVSSNEANFIIKEDNFCDNLFCLTESEFNFLKLKLK